MNARILFGHKSFSTHFQRAGFTIIELLIVIVVIGILAAITFVVYNGINQQANASAAQAAVAQAVKKITTYAVTNADQYPSDLATGGVIDANGTVFQYSVNNTAKTFCVTATRNNVSYFQNNTTQPTPASGACLGHSLNGVDQIVNLSSNPALGSDMTGWTLVGGAGSSSTPSLQTSGGPAGISNTYYRRLVSVAATSSPLVIGAGSSGLNGIPVDGGWTYMLSVYVRTSCNITSYRLDVNDYDSAGASIGSVSSGVALGDTVNVWQRLTRAYVTDPSAAYIQVRPTYSGGLTVCGAGTTFDSTAAMITKGSTTYNYADGNSPGWTWTGATNNSVSTGPAL